MNNDFLSQYTIPLLPNNAAPVAPANVETPQQQAIPVLATPTDFNRYYAPGKQEPGQYVPPPPPSRPQKRKYDIFSSGPQIFTGRDASYPDELNALIKPLMCDLCNVKMNSPKSAKDHYQSKTHDKKLTAWIAQNYPENPPEIKRFAHEAREGEGGADAQYCKLCDLKLTSLVHARQHYSGRKHQLVASNISNPKGAGYYDAEGKWVRTGSKLTPTVENDGRFGIGLGFKATEVKTENPSNTDENSAKNPATPSHKPTNPTSPDESLCCKVCKISVTSAPQMATHIKGARHRKSLARLLNDSDADAVTSSMAIETLLNVVQSSKPNYEDFCMFRTPCGSYYCQTCNMSLSSVPAFQQHIKGKKHMKIVADQKMNEAKAAKTKAK